MDRDEKARCGLTGWWAGFHLGVSHWSRPDAAANGDGRFLSLNKIGEVGPAVSEVSWNLELGLPEAFQDAEVRMFCNGYEVRTSTGDFLYGYMPAPGVYLLQGPEALSAQLFCAEREVEGEEGGRHRWLEIPGQLVHLARTAASEDDEEHLFCLQVITVGDESGSSDPDAAAERAEGYLDMDLPGELDLEFQRRLPFFDTYGRPAQAPSTLLALETLVSHLQPPEAGISGLWISDGLEAEPSFAANHVYAAIAAWNLVDIEVSKTLVRSVLSIQTNSGSIDALYEPQDPEGSYLCMWPILAQCCRMIWDHAEEQVDLRQDPGFFADVLPRVDEHVQYCLEYFNIEASGYHGWRFADEAVVPEMYDENLVSVPLTALLVSEVEELTYLSGVVPEYRPEGGWLTDERARLSRNLSEAWNEKAHAYTDFYLNGDPVARVSMGSYFPMRWTGVDPALATETEKQLKSNESLLTPDGMALWQAWDTDELAPPVEALHQLFVQPILNRSGLIDQQGAYMQGISDAQEAWFAAGRGLVADLSLERNEFGDVLPVERGSFNQDLGGACLNLVSRVTAQKLDVNISDYPWVVRWLERHRQTATLVASLLLFVTVVGAAVYFAKTKGTGAREEYTLQGIARNNYQLGRYEEAIEQYTDLIEISNRPAVRGDYQFMLANAYFKVKNWEQAAIYYRKSVKNAAENVPQPGWNLTQALYRLGQYEEAKTNLDDWLERFAEHYPDLEARARVVREIIDQQIARQGHAG